MSPTVAPEGLKKQNDKNPEDVGNKVVMNIERKHRIVKLMRDTASKLMEDIDPWKHHNIHIIPAERVIRHMYHPITQSWTTEETIVKMEAEPFTHGAMRYCFRLKKRSTPPIHSTNHHFHKIGWSFASNYVAKAYINKDGMVDTSDAAKQNIRNDIVLQYEAQHWADQFNQRNPPKKIHFLKAYAIEFPNRLGRPWFAVERFITGKDPYGKRFIKHNTNAGYVDKELRRVTPQIFSAFSFYSSSGHRLVADIQGIGDLYTDPQVLSSDYRFGDGDLGPRGMAFFFTHFRNCTSSDALGIPMFPLSKNERRYHQMKYDDEEVTISDDDTDPVNDDESLTDLDEDFPVFNRFQKLDLNRQRRSSILLNPSDLTPLSRRDTVRRSNVTSVFTGTSSQLHHGTVSKRPLPSQVSKTHLHRTKSDMDEVQICLERAKCDHIFTHTDFHRHKSGDLKMRQFKAASSSVDSTEDDSNNENKGHSLRSTMVIHKSTIIQNGGIAPPIPMTKDTRMNLGRVHYQLAILHGLGRFHEIVVHPKNSIDTEDAHATYSNDKNKCHGETEILPNHDVFTVLFHLSHAASLHNVASCLSLGRVQAGLSTQVSALLSSIVPIDFESAKFMFRRALTSPFPPSQPKVAAGCLLYQLLMNELKELECSEATGSNNEKSSIGIEDLVSILEETLQLMRDMELEKIQAQQHQAKISEYPLANIMIGNRVESNFSLEGTYYSATVMNIEIKNDIEWFTVKYDDDDYIETLSGENVRLIIPATATQTTLGGPLSDKDIFGTLGSDQISDDNVLFLQYELLSDLARFKKQLRDYSSAAMYFVLASEEAMNLGKMKLANEWILEASSLNSLL